MENSFANKGRYDREKEDAEKLYSTIGRVWCPILTKYINFNRVGFEHLMRRGMKWRPKDDQIRRFRLLRYAESVIQDEGSVLVQKSKEDIFDISMRFWAITKRVDDRIVVVVIRQTKKGQKHFFSIYDQKTAR